MSSNAHHDVANTIPPVHPVACVTARRRLERGSNPSPRRARVVLFRSRVIEEHVRLRGGDGDWIRARHLMIVASKPRPLPLHVRDVVPTVHPPAVHHHGEQIVSIPTGGRRSLPAAAETRLPNLARSAAEAA